MDFDRRTLLKLGTSTFFGMLLGRYARADAAPAAAAKARACILLWLNGGPSHIDTFDPKPGAPFKPLRTRAADITLSEHLPRLAEQAHHLAVVRSMSSREGNHQRAQYFVHTGYSPNPTVQHPSLGGWISSKLGDPSADLPAFVSIGGPSWGAGFLGVENGPFVLAKAGEAPANTALSPGVDEARFARRRDALDMLEARFEAQVADAKVGGRRAVYAKAVRLMHSPRLGAFEIAEEPAAIRAAYGETDFGRGCLLARRLIESGVKFVEVVLDGWDTHQNAFERERALMGTLDPGFGALIGDLAARNLLPQTLVLCMGEFGRTPRINANDGRDHYPKAWSAVLAGGGVRGGVVVGQTDAEGANVLGKPTSVPDLLATAAMLMGLDPTLTVTTPSGRPLAVTDGGAPVQALL